MNHRIVVCRALDGPDALALESVPTPDPGPGEIRLAVRASGVNYPDLLMTRGAYQLRLEPPFTPGMEVAGVVEAVGEGVTDYRAGDHVIGHVRHGGYAEKLLVPTAAAVPLPTPFSYAEGATFLVAGRTAYHALVDRGAVASGETLLVLGATGGVGLAAVELGALLGARVIAVGSDDGRLEVARQRGATEVVNYRRRDLREAVEAIAGRNAVDVVYDPVGGELSRQSTSLLAWGGRLLVVGFASGEIPVFPANHALLKGYSIVGLRAGEASRRAPELGDRSRQALLDYAERGHLRPHVSLQYPLDDVVAAMKALEARAVVGRMALLP